MFSVPHLVVIFIVVLVVFGPHKLPELARSLGKMMAEFRKASTDFKMAFEEEMRNIERQAREAELKKVQDAATKQAATETAMPAEPERILPSTVEPIEPTVVPVSESVAHQAHTDEDQPVTEGTAPEQVNSASELSDSSQGHASPSHDQRQPA